MNYHAELLNTAHEVVKFDGKTYFIAKCPEGNFCVHQWDPKQQDGYGGAYVTFRINFGWLKTVKGPFKMSLSWRDYKSLVEYLGRPELNNEVYKFSVLKKTVSHGRTLDELISSSTSWRAAPIKDVIRSEWQSYYLDIHIKDGYSLCGVAVSSILDYEGDYVKDRACRVV